MRSLVSLGFLIVAGLFVFTCNAERAPVLEDLVGSEFLLADVGGRGVVDACQSTLKFQTEEQVAGNGGCNRYFGSVEWKGDSIKFGRLGVTQRMCPDAVMEQERQFLAALGEAYHVEMDGAYLYIHTREADSTLKFTRLVKDPGEQKTE